MQHRAASIKFTTKLFAGILAILVFAVFSLITITEMDVSKGLMQFGRKNLESIHQAVFNSLVAQNAILEEKLTGDVLVLEGELEKYGHLALDSSEFLERTITNQITKSKEQARMPRLMSGATVVNGNTEIVDKVQNMVGAVATIFQVLDGKLLRVSTNVHISQTERAVDTYIPADSPVYKAVMRGETYTGRAFVVNDWYLTAYKPVQKNGKTIAVLFVGRKILTPQLKEMISTTKAAGVGYFFLYDSNGKFFIHPTQEGKNIFEIPVTGDLFRQHKGGFLDYDWDGAKTTYTAYFEPWDWYLGVGMNEDQILQGLDTTILTHSLMAGVAIIAIGIAIAILLVRAIANPLNHLAAQSLKVAEGDYTVTFTHTAKDAIGNLSESMNTMVERTKEMLREIIGATQALAASSTELSSISTQMTTNSSQTTRMANTVSTASEEVSSNMNSVSAAMEEASVNMSTVAAAAEEMSATIHEIAQNSERAKNTTAQAVVKAQNTTTKVNDLGVAAKEISAVTATITAISSQTNLLALNATIEAARAGEAGRGFAVVANEIKELAQQTARATEDIRGKITGIQAVTSDTVREISDITNVIHEMNDIVGTIAAAVEEQSVTTRDIAENVGQASMGINEITGNVASTSNKTHGISTDIEHVRSASDEMTVNSQTVQESAAELSHLAERLRELVSRFHI